MGKASAPSPPDPAATSAAQSTANVNTAAAQAALNRTNQFTPYGSTTYEQSGSYTTPGGETVPTFNQYTSLSPLAQQMLTGEQTIGASLMPTAWELGQQAGESATKPLIFDTPYSETLNQGPQLLSQNTTDALYRANTRFMDPQWADQKQQLQDQLSRQGIPVGSDAYANAMRQYDSSRTQAYDQARDAAVAGGTSAAGNLFNMAMAGQQQNLSQQQLAQSNPIALLQQLIGAAPSTQSQPVMAAPTTQIAPTDVVGATGLASNAAQQGYQAQVSNQNALYGGVATIGAAAAAAIII